MTRRAIVLAEGTQGQSVTALESLLRACKAGGVTEAVVLVGQDARDVESALRAGLARELGRDLALSFPAWPRSGGWVSALLAARENVGRGCLLATGEAPCSAETVWNLRTLDLAEDACAVAGAMMRIGPGLFDALDALRAADAEASLEDALALLEERGKLVRLDVDEPFALDADETDGGVLSAEAIELFAPSWVRAAQPYNEDHFALAERRGAGAHAVARMMSNESPYRPSLRVMEAIMEAALGGNHYPSRAAELRAKIAARAGGATALDADHVLLGAGSAELIDLAVRAFVAPGEETLISVPTFSMYEARTRVAGGIPVLVPLDETGALDLGAIIAAVTERTKLVFVCTPNNPTGNRVDVGTLCRLLRLGLPTVIDEAYHEFAADDASLAHLLADHPNAILLRTFSKAYGLAGLRVGYALARPVIVRLLGRVKLPWSVSSIAIAAACAALDDEVEQRRRVRALRVGRAYLEREIARLPGMSVLPTEANFVLVDVQGAGLGADEMVERLLARGIFVRSLASHRAGRGLLRITVGDASQNRRCLEALRAVVSERPAASQPRARAVAVQPVVPSGEA
jgi:histidinol-phosphate aminotransferase